MFRDGAERLLVFRVGAERFGVALAAIRQVVDAPAVRRLPDAAPSLLGVATVRDELIPLYDARRILGVEEGAGAGAGEGEASIAPGVALIFSADAGCVALAIDDVFDPVLVEEHELRPMPGAGAADAIIRGLVRRGSDLVAVLDDETLVDTMLAIASSSEAI